MLEPCGQGQLREHEPHHDDQTDGILSDIAANIRMGSQDRLRTVAVRLSRGCVRKTRGHAVQRNLRLAVEQWRPGRGLSCSAPRCRSTWSCSYSTTPLWSSGARSTPERDARRRVWGPAP